MNARRTLRSLRVAALTAVLGLASTCSLAVAQTSSSSTTSSGSSGGTTSSSSSGIGSGSGIGTSGSGSGSTGTSGTGSTSPFAGNVATGFGTQSTAGMTTSGSTTGAPTASNPFQKTYVNPYAVGISAGNTTGTTTATKAYGTASVFVATTTAKYNTGSSTIATVNSNAGQGFTTLTLPKSIPYATALSEDVPYVTHVPSAMQAKLAGLLARSTMLPDRGQMRVNVEGNVVILSGKAASVRDRERAERILRTEPGVTDVVNRIQVAGAPNPNQPTLASAAPDQP